MIGRGKPNKIFKFLKNFLNGLNHDFAGDNNLEFTVLAEYKNYGRV